MIVIWQCMRMIIVSNGQQVVCTSLRGLVRDVAGPICIHRDDKDVTIPEVLFLAIPAPASFDHICLTGAPVPKLEVKDLVVLVVQECNGDVALHGRLAPFFKQRTCVILADHQAVLALFDVALKQGLLKQDVSPFGVKSWISWHCGIVDSSLPFLGLFWRQCRQQ